MTSLARTLARGTVLLFAVGGIGRADVTLPNCPAAYRLQNAAMEDPRIAGCGRCEPLPPRNPGCWLNNPHGTGVDDPWRPPRFWPQTRYPIVPAYARPSYGYHETSWRILPVCTNPPVMRIPAYPMPQSAGVTPRPSAVTPRQTPSQTPGQQPSPTDEAPPRAVPPKATPQQKPPRPAEAAPKLGQDDMPQPVRSAMADPDGSDMRSRAPQGAGTGANSETGTSPEIEVRAF